MDLPEKKSHLESGLNQRGRAKSAASPIKKIVEATIFFPFPGLCFYAHGCVKKKKKRPRLWAGAWESGSAGRAPSQRSEFPPNCLWPLAEALLPRRAVCLSSVVCCGVL